MALQQVVMALLKYKILVSESSQIQADNIDRYLANIVMIANKYKGVAFWYYHAYFWDKAAEYREQGVGINWSVLDAEALHAALANNSCTNYCTYCHSWYHSTSTCPFNLHGGEVKPVTVVESSESATRGSNWRGKAYFRGKEICNKFNFSHCTAKENCTYLHMCRFCNKFNHGLKDCTYKDGQ